MRAERGRELCELRGRQPLEDGDRGEALLQRRLGGLEGDEQQVAKLHAAERVEQRHAARAAHGRRARAVVQQRQLAERVAGAERAHAVAIAVVVADVRGEGALGDDVELVARVTLRDHGLALASNLLAHRVRGLHEEVLLRVGEELVRAQHGDNVGGTFGTLVGRLPQRVEGGPPARVREHLLRILRGDRCTPPRRR